MTYTTETNSPCKTALNSPLTWPCPSPSNSHPAPVQQETVSVFNLVSDNPLINGIALAASGVLAVVVIAVTIARFFG